MVAKLEARLKALPDREPGVLYIQGLLDGVWEDYRAIEVNGLRYERVRECEYVYDDEYEWFACSACGMHLWHLGMSASRGEHGEVIREAIHDGKVFCPYCGARVKEVDA